MHRHGPGYRVSHRSNSDFIYLRPQHVLPSFLQTRRPGGAIQLPPCSPSSTPTFVPGTEAMLPGTLLTRAISPSFVLCLGTRRGEIYSHSFFFTISAIKGQTSLPEEQPERFADILYTQKDPLLLPPHPSPQKGSPGCPPHLAPPKLSCQNLGGNHQATPSQG